MTKRVLVVGGAGYVGTELVRELLRRGHKATIFDCVAARQKEVECLTGDFVNAEAVKKILGDRKFEYIFHVASLPGDTGNPYEMLNVNVVGLLNMLEWVRAHPVERLVLTGSLSALEWYPGTKFNPPDYLPVDEEHPDRPKDMYASTKRMQELLALTYYHEYKVPTTVLRLTAVVGPGGKGGGRGYRQLAEMLKAGKSVQIPHFSAEEMCQYVDIRDVARMQLAVAEHPAAVGEIFNCCAKEPTRGHEFAAIIKKLVPGIEVQYGFAWSMAQGGEISFSMEKARRVLGFEPKYTLEDALVSIKEWVDGGGLEESAAGKIDGEFLSGVIKNK